MWYQTLIDLMERYFPHANTGRRRSSLIIPEPLFVHSDLTTMIQMADLIAYIVSWGRLKRSPTMRPSRPFVRLLTKQGQL
jgi:hypothetical protein